MRCPCSKSAASGSTQVFSPGTLWRCVVERSRLATERGVLHTIDTEQRYVADGDVTFVIRVVSNLARKERQRDAQRATDGGPRPNPFSPPEPELLVAAASDTHWAVLNKFNVLDRHLLIVTREFEHQETLLNTADFDALWRCLGEYDGLGFYNGGVTAGASQAHKHLQLVPLPLADSGPPIPIAPVLRPTAAGVIGVSAGLPFRHAFVNLDTEGTQSEALASLYRTMLRRVGIAAVEDTDGARQSLPYNLLVTREWMLLVPRSREYFGTISINALGFAGSFFVKNPQQARKIIQAGPMAVLKAVAFVV